MESGAVQIVARDLTAPSPFAAEALNARPYAFLDDAPLEERRTQAVMSRRYADADSADDLGRLDPAAIESVRDGSVAARARCRRDARGADGRWASSPQRGRRRRIRAWPRPGCSSSPTRSRARRCCGPRTHGARTASGSPPNACRSCRRCSPTRRWHPPIEAPAEYAREPWSREDAAVELVRSRLTGLGPVPAAALAESLQLPLGEIELALLRLETEGYVMRGRFTPQASAGGSAEEWCERHLLARIHRYTIGRLRREIEPVEPRDFMRFLFDWQRVSPATRVSGPEALAGVLAQLEGFEAPAAAWESELLPARVGDYSIAWLDDLCTAGRVAWARLRGVGASASGAEPAAAARVRATPIVLLPRRQLPLWTGLTAHRVRGRAGAVVARGTRRRASRRARRLVLRRDGRGRAPAAHRTGGRAGRTGRARPRHCDSFAGLRALLVPGAKRPTAFARRGRRAALFGIEDAGRWTLTRRACARDRPTRNARPRRDRDVAEAVEHVARTLLRRYGVVFWRLLEREAAWLPPWRELLRVYHRLEARGEIRGGRFVAGLSGEQFALPDAIGALRAVRNRAARRRAAQPVRVRSAEPGRHRAAGREGAAHVGRTRAVSRRRAGGDAGRRQCRGVDAVVRRRTNARCAAP